MQSTRIDDVRHAAPLAQLMSWVEAVLEPLLDTDSSDSYKRGKRKAPHEQPQPQVDNRRGTARRLLSCFKLALQAGFPSLQPPQQINSASIVVNVSAIDDTAALVLCWMICERPMILTYLHQQMQIVQIFSMSLPLTCSASWIFPSEAPGDGDSLALDSFLVATQYVSLSFSASHNPRSRSRKAPRMDHHSPLFTALSPMHLMEYLLDLVQHALSWRLLPADVRASPLVIPRSRVTQSQSENDLGNSSRDVPAKRSRIIDGPASINSFDRSSYSTPSTFPFLRSSAATLLRNGSRCTSSQGSIALQIKGISTGCSEIDRSLGGCGWRYGQVSEIFGEAGTGKTQVLLQSLLTHSARRVCAEWISMAIRECMPNYPNRRDSLVSSVKSLMEDQENQLGECDAGFILWIILQEIRGEENTDSLQATRPLIYLASEDIPARRLGELGLGAFKKEFETLLAITAAIESATQQLHVSNFFLEVTRKLKSVGRSPTNTSVGIPIASFVTNEVLRHVLIRRVHTVNDLRDLLVSAELQQLFPPTTHSTGSEDGGRGGGGGGLNGGGMIALDSIAAAVAASRAAVMGDRSDGRAAQPWNNSSNGSNAPRDSFQQFNPAHSLMVPNRAGQQYEQKGSSYAITETLSEVALRLRRLAQSCNVAILIANQARAPITSPGKSSKRTTRTSCEGNEQTVTNTSPHAKSRYVPQNPDVIPALGFNWLLTAHTRVRLLREHTPSAGSVPVSAEGNPSRRRLLVLYSPFTGPAECYYSIGSDGIRTEAVANHALHTSSLSLQLSHRDVEAFLKEK